jgi:hypothetical protein
LRPIVSRQAKAHGKKQCGKNNLLHDLLRTAAKLSTSLGQGNPRSRPPDSANHLSGRKKEVQ